MGWKSGPHPVDLTADVCGAPGSAAIARDDADVPDRRGGVPARFRLECSVVSAICTAEVCLCLLKGKSSTMKFWTSFNGD